MYKLIALIGKSGAGKDTVLKELLKQKPDFNEVISCTTRPPREGEVDGINYYFITKEQFFDKMKNNEMLEYCSFNNWYYGTPISSLKKDKVNIGVFNPAGIRELHYNKEINLEIFYITARDKIRLLRQLNREENPNVNEIIRRYDTDTQDFLWIEDDFNPCIIVNDYDETPETCAAQVILHVEDKVD